MDGFSRSRSVYLPAKRGSAISERRSSPVPQTKRSSPSPRSREEQRMDTLKPHSSSFRRAATIRLRSPTILRRRNFSNSLRPTKLASGQDNNDLNRRFCDVNLNYSVRIKRNKATAAAAQKQRESLMCDLRDSNKWTCPSDRQLLLRAQLNTGWSTRTGHKDKGAAAKSVAPVTSPVRPRVATPTHNEKPASTGFVLPRPANVSEAELEQIQAVLDRARAVDDAEAFRVGRLVSGMEHLQSRARGDPANPSECMLCGQQFTFWSARTSAGLCRDCQAHVCRRHCGVELRLAAPVGAAPKSIFLCKICNEKRETYKKSNAWFYSRMPAYVLPTEDPYDRDRTNSLCLSPRRRPASPGGGSLGAAKHEPQLVAGPRRRLPMPPPDKDGASRSSPNPGGTLKIRPRWAEEAAARLSEVSRKLSSKTSNMVNMKAVTGRNRAGSNSSSEGELMMPQRRVLRTQKFESSAESEPPSDDDVVDSPMSSAPSGGRKSMSPTSSQDPLVPPTRSGLGRLSGGHAGDTSDARSIDSGFVHSDRSQTAGGSAQRTGGDSGLTTPQEERVDITPTPRKTPEVKSAGPREVREAREVPAKAEPEPRRVSPLTQRDEDTTPVNVPSSPSPELDEDSMAVPTCSTIEDDAGPQSNPKSKTWFGMRKETKMPAVKGNLGTFEFDLLFDPKDQTLNVTINRADNLRAMDSNGFSDPYCKIYLLPGASKSTKLRTKTIHKTLHPEWNETLTYYGITEDELLRKTLRLTLYDEDRIGSDFLGETRVQLKRLTAGETRSFKVYLDKEMPVDKPEDDGVSERGKILLTMQYVPDKTALLVHVVRCAELLGMDASGYSDPYVKVFLKPGDKKQRFKTHIKKKTCNPEFNEEFCIKCPMEELKKKQLYIEVYDHDVGKSDDFIGGLMFGLTAKGERLRQWSDTLKNPGNKFQRWHKLLDEMAEEV